MDLIAGAVAALGVSDPTVLNSGGQKLVIQGELEGERVALKIVRLAGGSEGPEIALERALREFDALDGARNAHVVGTRSDLVTISDEHGTQAVAWAEEFIDGDDLRKLLTTECSWDETSLMIRDVCLGLAAFHSRGIVHRDLSPANVMRRSQGGFVILDPGYARFTDYTSITTAGQPGTPGHLSPEHFDVVDGPEPRSDIFQLGILAYLALAQKLPFPVNDAAALLAGAAPPIAAARPDLSAAQSALVQRCIARRPARRFRSADDLLSALEDLP